MTETSSFRLAKKTQALAAGPSNLGVGDWLARAAIGLALVAYAMPRGIDSVTWHWVGLFGALLVVTAVLRRCPLYQRLGLSTASNRSRLPRRRHAGTKSSPL